MGQSCSWIAVRRKKTELVLGALALRRPGFLESHDGSWFYGEMPEDWLIVFSARSAEPPAFADSALREISAGCELVASSVEEHAMCSSAVYWRDGAKVWSVLHDGQKGDDHIAISGNPPKAEAEDEDGEAIDPFYTPLAIGAQMTGFRHEESTLRPLVSAAGSVQKPWWKIW